MLLLELRSLECVRGMRTVFSDVSARVHAGEMLCVTGANGSGKTSLLRMICGLSQPASGEVRWRGQSIGESRETFNAQVAYLGHAPALKEDLSAIENLRASAGLSGSACSSDEAAAALAYAGLRGREHLPVRTLSQGQRKRASLARLALRHVAPLWVLDEPYNALDADACGWLQRLIDLHIDRGGVVVLTSHQDLAWDDGSRSVTVALGETQAVEVP